MSIGLMLIVFPLLDTPPEVLNPPVALRQSVFVTPRRK